MAEDVEQRIGGYIDKQGADFQRRLESASAADIPYRFNIDASAGDIQSRYAHLRPGELLEDSFSMAGRLMRFRKMGGMSFGDIRDRSGKVQVSFRRDAFGQAYDDLGDLDIGDIIGVQGNVYKTKTGELTVNVKSYTLLAKALRHMPDKFHGLKDPEMRYRQRYLDLISSPEAMQRAMKRVELVNNIRQQLNEKGFLEVETPVLQPIYGGANARPFRTHHNALDMNMFLRISNELYLKRLIIGGLERVYEFARDFRNEGIDAKHNPEFTQLEIYQAYADYTDMMKLVEEMISHAAININGCGKVQFRGQEIDLTNWQRMSMKESIQKFAGIKVDDFTDQQLAAKLEEKKVKVRTFSRGTATAKLFEEYVEDKLVQPTIIFDYPVEISPLARRHRSDPNLVERFEFYIGSMELGNSYSELQDPIEQRRRFEYQRVEREKGDEEAHQLDDDFILAMEHGMPPTGGLGIGIDRLAAVISGADTVRESLLFPTLRKID